MAALLPMWVRRSEGDLPVPLAHPPALFAPEGLAAGGERRPEPTRRDEDGVGAHGRGAPLADIEGTVGDLGVSSEERRFAGLQGGLQDCQGTLAGERLMVLHACAA